MPAMRWTKFIYEAGIVLSTAICFNNTGCAQNPPLQFNWGAPQHFLVTETIQKKQTEIKVVHECELLKTNDEYALQWLDAKITEYNGTKVSGSEDLKKTLKPVEESFVYPTFRITSDGDFVEAINLEDSVKKTDQMLDKVTPNRDDDNRKFFANFAKTESGKRMLNQIFGLIWQTWVEAWTGVTLSDGKTDSSTEPMTLSKGQEVQATEKITNLGPVKSNTNLLSLKYEQRVFGTNFLTAMNSFIGNMAKETGITGAGPITNECTIVRLTTLEAQTERHTLRPYWAKSTVRTTVASPGEPTETQSEIHEYQFEWSPQKGH